MTALRLYCRSLQTDDGGMSDDHNRGMSEHDKDCGRLFIPNDDTANPLYGGFQVMDTQEG